MSDRKYTIEDFRSWGRLGGLKGGSVGGKRSAEKLTPEERVDRARRAANARHYKTASPVKS
jgi:hypothetical protein